MKKNNWLDLLIFVLFANIFFFHAFGTVALALLLSGIWVLIQRIFGRGDKVASGILGLTIGAMFFVDSPEKTVLLIALACAVFLVQTYLLIKKDQIGGILELVMSGLYVIREYLRSGLAIAGGLIRGNLRNLFHFEQLPKQKSPWLRSTLTGVLVGLPLIAWLTYTLTQADPVFATYVKNLLSEEFLNELPGRFFFSVLTFLFLLPTLLMSWRGYVSPLGWLTRMKWGREMAIVTGMVVVVLGVFLAVQWPYVFVSVAKETDLSKYGVATYSEYVTKGFWDLLKVVIMVLGVAWTGALISQNQSERERKILLWVQGILGVEFGVFILSIFRRVWLYQYYHGLTLARLYGLALLILIVGMTVTMAMRYLYPKIRWVKVEAGWIIFMIFATIILNMEGLVVKVPPTVNNRVDYVYLSRLSGDGFEGWRQAYENTNSKLEGIVNAKLPGIGVDNRREVFYRGLILGQLTVNYDRLIWQYGTEEEIKAYLRAIVDWQEMILIKYPEIATAQFSGGSEEVRSGIGAVRKALEGNEWGKAGVVVKGGGYLVSGTYLFSGYSDEFYYLIKDGLGRSRRLSDFDRMMSWNYKDESVYRRMKEELPIADLLQGIESYWKVRLQILTQPETERTVEIDASFNSPFLR